jgi:hypothetical protein
MPAFLQGVTVCRSSSRQLDRSLFGFREGEVYDPLLIILTLSTNGAFTSHWMKSRVEVGAVAPTLDATKCFVNVPAPGA